MECLILLTLIIIIFLQEPHVNTCYKHFYYFITEFELVINKELEPLMEMTKKMCHDSLQNR